MRTFRVAAAAAAAVLSAAPASAQGLATGIPFRQGRADTQVGLSGATFLEIPVGARETAMGGAAAASTTGLSALYWNTAGAAEIQHVSGAVSYSDLYGGSGLSHVFAALGFPFGGSSVAGLSFTYFTSGDIVRTTEQFPEGGDPTAGGLIRWDGFAAGLHYARRLTDRLSVGVAGKYVSEGVDFATARYVAGDFSALFHTGLFATTLGAAVTNLGTAARFRGPALERNIPSARDVFPVSRDVNVQFRMEDVPLPTSVQFAASTELLGSANALFQSGSTDHGVVFNAAVTDANDRALQPSFGLEYRFRNVFFARAGKKFFNEADAPWSGSSGLSAGFGLAFPVMDRRFTLDYAVTRYGALPNTHSFTFQFGY